MGFLGWCLEFVAFFVLLLVVLDLVWAAIMGVVDAFYLKFRGR